MNTKQAVELLRLVADRLTAHQSIQDIGAEVSRLQANADVIHQNILRQAKQDAADDVKAMMDDARKRAEQSAEDAQEEASKILREAQVKAMQIVADAETRARGLEEHIVVEKAKALLSKTVA
jgi:cell division septum initiation protein DivIVA